MTSGSVSVTAGNETPPTCMVCGEPVKKFGSSARYPKTCSAQCLSVVRARNGTNNRKKSYWNR